MGVRKIKQSTIMRAVSRTKRTWDNHVRQVALEEGIPDSYRPILMFLHWNPGSSQKRIAEFAGVTTSAINQAVKSMLQDAYLRKETDPSDKRNSRLYLTEKGEETAGRIRKRLDDSDHTITEYLGAEKEAELIELLDKLEEFVRKELE